MGRSSCKRWNQIKETFYEISKSVLSKFNTATENSVSIHDLEKMDDQSNRRIQFITKSIYSIIKMDSRFQNKT